MAAPYEHSERTRILVQPDGDQDIYLCPPLYHDEHTLVYRIYGHNLLPKLEALGFSVGYVRQAFKRWGVIPMDMIVCRKDAPLADDRRHPVRFDREWPR